MITGHTHVAAAGVLAAELLAEACRAGNGLQAETVRELAEDLGSALSPLPDSGTADSLVEAALACADLATLAACNVAGLGGPPSVAAAPLAAGAARALAALAEAEIGAAGDAYAENASRDLRSAVWKADLAVRQLGEAG
jgi:hypothetical protein